MWLFTPTSFLSIVAHRDKPHHLLVRARFRGDIGQLFPRAQVTHTPLADYPYRAVVTRNAVAKVLAEQAQAMDYPNVKGAIGVGPDHDYRYLAMTRVWEVMRDAGARRMEAAP